MKLVLLKSLAAALLLGNMAHAAAPAAQPPSCVVVSDYYSQISAESNAWQRARLDALSEPTSACEELQLGLLLSHPAVAFQNDAKALDSLSRALLMLPVTAVDKGVLSMVIDHIEERQTLRNMLGKSQRQLRYRQQRINTLRGQINQLKNLEAQLEDKARAALIPNTVETDTAAETTAAETKESVPEQSEETSSE